jgi:transcriptional regulator with XRE-family HTH domain
MNKYAAALRGVSTSVEYFTQIAMRRFVMNALERMDRLSISRAKLADSLGASPSYVSRVMRGDVNFTLETMTKLALATGGRLDVRIVDSSTAANNATLDLDRFSGVSAVVHRPAIGSTTMSRTLAIEPANEATFETVLPRGRVIGGEQNRVACG